ncbi:MAG: hypothetical protein JRN52_10385 [Nitrososphaerota archaeon]|nr:hypothetical protein [Nitrososphaerota archaeon]
MPKVSRRKPAKKRSSISKRKQVSPKSSRKVRRSPSKKAISDTFDAWIDAQAKRSRPTKGEEKPSEAAKMPVDSMEEWLEKQQVVEKEVPAEGKLPMDSMEVWLEHQVSERQSKVTQEAAEGAESAPAADTAQTQATTESTPNTTSTTAQEFGTP